MKAPRPTAPVFFKSGSASHVKKCGDPTKGAQSTAELLNWISAVTIKRRVIRRATHCSNLVAEAILSSALRKAKKELAQKQEEKRRKIKLFCLGRSQATQNDDDSDFELVKNPSPPCAKTEAKPEHKTSYKVSYVLTELNDNSSESVCDAPSYLSAASYSNGYDNMHSSSCGDDAEVDACLSGLDAFFQQLKSVQAGA